MSLQILLFFELVERGSSLQSRKNVTKENPDRLSTPQRPTREQILWDSPERITRRYEIVTHLTYVI
jgi:hypothetical protein